MTYHEQCLELAKLMREGCKKAKQYKGGHMHEQDATCALGAVLDALDKLNYYKNEEDYYCFLAKEFPVLLEKPISYKSTLKWLIIDKNDSYGSTREEIADWLEALEWNDPTN